MTSKHICNLTIANVRDKLNKFNWSSLDVPGKNKGKRGQQFELAMNIPNTSNLTDLKDGEVKTVSVGETVACTQLKHCLNEIVGKKPFEDSKFGKKMNNVLFIGFEKNSNKYLGNKVFNRDNYPNYYKKIKEDYEYISEQIRNSINNKSILKTINGPNKLLQIRTKASKYKGRYSPLKYNDIVLKDKNMAFYLRADFPKMLFP